MVEQAGPCRWSAVVEKGGRQMGRDLGTKPKNLNFILKVRCSHLRILKEQVACSDLPWRASGAAAEKEWAGEVRLGLRVQGLLQEQEP